MPLRPTWTNSAQTTYALMPYCDSYGCMKPASTSAIDYIEIEAPRWYLRLGYPRYELMDESDRYYGCLAHPVFQQVRMLNGNVVPVPMEFPKTRLHKWGKELFIAAIFAIICAVLGEKYLSIGTKLYVMLKAHWILVMALLLGLFGFIIGEMFFSPSNQYAKSSQVLGNCRTHNRRFPGAYGQCWSPL
jgi:hypothetical protein